MGRATRWLRSLLTGKKDTKDPKGNPTRDAPAGEDRREKKRWSFGKPGRGLDDAAVAVAGKDSAWLRSFGAESEEERSRRAMAVAAATAAAAEAAVAAAQAAVAVVRLTSYGRGAMFGGGARERWAAVRIQTVFRGYLARKALRALKSLVKLQALVRGYLVRRQAAEALHRMQALVRAQATARTQRITGGLRPRRSLERLDETRREYAASFHSVRPSSCMDHVGDLNESPKVMEVDPGRPRSRNRRTGADVARLDTTPGDSPPHSSPLPRQLPTWISFPDPRGKSRDLDWCLTGDECRFSTAQNTPRFMNSGWPATPARSLCGDFMRKQQSPCHHHHPNYMTKTQSFEAKLRSQSAPKHRPEPAGPRKWPSLNEVVEARASVSVIGARMQRSCSHAQEAFVLGNAGVVGTVDHSAEFGRGVERDYSFHRMRW